MFHLYHVSKISSEVQFSDNAMVGSYFQKVVKPDTKTQLHTRHGKILSLKEERSKVY